MFEGGAKPVDVSVAVRVQRTRAVGDSVPTGEARIGGLASSARISRTNLFIAGVNRNLTPLQRRALIGRSLLDTSGKKLLQWLILPISARTCFTSLGIGILANANTFSALGRRPAGEMEWPRKFASVAPNRAFLRERFRLCFRRRSKREIIV